MMAARYGAKRKPNYINAAKVRRAMAALGLPDGGVRPYRPMPADFRETYIRMGWDGIDEHYRTNWRVIRRWLELVGRKSVIEARAAFVAEQRTARRSRRRPVA